jgi:hypothetical protein
VLAGAVAAIGAPGFRTLHGALAGLVAGLAGTLVVAVSRTTSGCVEALLVVEGRPCGKPPSGEYIAGYLAPVLTLGIIGAALAAALVAGILWLARRRRVAL